MSDEPRKKIGRPRKYPDTGKRPTLSFRVRGDLYERIAALCAENELSLSEQTERLLMGHFEREEMEQALRRIVREEVRNASS